ncbi:MAG: PIN domain-containing protein [Thermodesulfovibrionales bacterium]|nr:PIN domain-containing protein [Thermodesulfovibrionales bacterium]
MATENAKVFIDTNILLYAYSSSEIAKKKKVLLLLENEMISLSTQVINEFIWIMSRKFNVGMDSLKLITSNLFELYEVSQLNESGILKAIDISTQLQFSYWDSLMVSSALAANCNVLYTEDLQHGQVIGDMLKVVNPFV